MKTLKIAAAVACLAFLPNLASAADGQALYKKKCSFCHSTDAGKNKGGPSLHSLFGTTAGTVAGYKKYKGLKGADFKWTAESLDGFLKNPKAFLGKKSSMMSKVKDDAERAAIVEYLKTK